MMKKSIASLFCIFLLMLLTIQDVSARTMWEPPVNARDAQLTFLRVKDEYMLLYNAYARPPAGAVAIRANYWTDFNQRYYEQIYHSPDGILYLTCNGTYIIEYLDSSMNVIAETKKIITTKIVNPPCQSYQQGGLQNDYNLSANRNNGQTNLSWNSVPNAQRYDVYENGETLLGTTTNTTYNTTGNANNYTVVAYDGNGNVIGTSDYYNDDINENLNGGGEGGGTCDACTMLTNALECPAWDDYMNELTQAIRNALPPPPNWDAIANTFVNKFSDYFGNVPVQRSVESISQITHSDLPQLDTTVPEANITPQVPNDFDNGPLDTSITSGTPIEIIQGSESFEIYEPDEFIEHDDVGVFVYPNDVRNSSNGIKQPDEIITDYVTPTPQIESSIIEHSEIPIPTQQTSITPTPTHNDFIIPIPDYKN